MRVIVWSLLICFMGVAATDVCAAGRNRRPRNKHSIGGGAHYYKTVDDVKLDHVDEDGLGWFASYQYHDGESGAFEFDVEAMPSGFAGATNDVYAPQFYLISSGKIYAGLGLGWFYSDGEWADDPFYAVRFGINYELSKGLKLDINGNYRFTKWDTDITQDLGTDTVTLAVALRLDL